MSEWLKIGDVLDVLRRYSRPIRFLALLVLFLLLFLFAHESFHWPGSWPTRDWGLNLLITAVLTLVVFCLVLTDPEDKASLDRLPETKPVLEESLKYFRLERPLERGRKDLIREFERRIRDRELVLLPQDLSKCAASPWEFDRIVHHLLVRYQANSDIEVRMGHVQGEKLLLDLKNWKGSLAPIHYAVEAVFDSSENREPPVLAKANLGLITEIHEKLNNWKTRLLRLAGLEIRGNKIIKNCQALMRSLPPTISCKAG
jgi:hypothetical protein